MIGQDARDWVHTLKAVENSFLAMKTTLIRFSGEVQPAWQVILHLMIRVGFD